MYQFMIRLAGNVFLIKVKNEITAQYFSKYKIKNTEYDEEVVVNKISCDDLSDISKRSFCRQGIFGASAEILGLAEVVSDTLLTNKNAMLFHGAAISYRNQAVVFAGPSGIGKTTQANLWLKYFSDDTYVINGDKPVVQCTGGLFFISSSPWEGKECYGQMGPPVPLSAIILLEQSDKNEIYKLSYEQSVLPIYNQIIGEKDSSERIRAGIELEERLLRSVPIYLLQNKADEEGVRLCRDVIFGQQRFSNFNITDEGIEEKKNFLPISPNMAYAVSNKYVYVSCCSKPLLIPLRQIDGEIMQMAVLSPLAGVLWEIVRNNSKVDDVVNELIQKDLCPAILSRNDVIKFYNFLCNNFIIIKKNET